LATMTTDPDNGSVATGHTASGMTALINY